MFTTPQDIKVKMFRSHREENRQRYVKKKRNYVKLSMSHTKSEKLHFQGHLRNLRCGLLRILIVDDLP